MIVEILEDAAEDIIAAHDWYESKRNGLGADFGLCIEETIGRVSYMPEAFPVWYRKTRRSILTRFPYGVFFVFNNNIVYVVGVFPLKRNPRWMKKNLNRRQT